ncbi:MAG: phage holin family protein [Candidatus Cloacimonadia bacterium]
MRNPFIMEVVSDTMLLYHLIRLFIYTLVVFLIIKPVKLIYIKSFSTALLFSLTIGFVNALIYPIFMLLEFPVTLLSLGFFLFIVNGLMLILSSLFIRNIHFNGFFRWILASILITLIVECIELSSLFSSAFGYELIFSYLS